MRDFDRGVAIILDETDIDLIKRLINLLECLCNQFSADADRELYPRARKNAPQRKEK